jgi:tetratricopeptide (TPR) repeat protein
MRSHLGDRTGALTAIDEAVTLIRQLAKTTPAALLPDLAMSLNNQANLRSQVGDRTGALVAIDKAVGIYRQLAQTNPDAFLPNLATSLRAQLELLAVDAQLPEAVATWAHAIADQHESVFRGELRAGLARAAAAHHQLQTAAEAIRQAAEEVTAEPKSIPPHALTRARLEVRTVAMSLDPQPRGLPAWAVAYLPEPDVQFVQAWVNSRSWTDRETAIDTYPHLFPARTLHRTAEVLAFLSPHTDGTKELIIVLEQIAERGAEPVLAELRDTESIQRLVEDWFTTDTWPASFTYLAEHEANLRRPEVLNVLTHSEHPTAAQYAAILRLSEALPAEAIQRIVTDPQAAEDEALSAVDLAKVDRLRQVMAACPQLIQAPGIGTFLLAVLTTLEGDADALDAVINIGSQTASPVQRRAYAIHLHRLAASLDHTDDLKRIHAALEHLVSILDPHHRPGDGVDESD